MLSLRNVVEKGMMLCVERRKNEINVFKQHLVVEEYSMDADKNYQQMLLEEAKVINPKAKVGDILEQKIDPKDFGHFAVRDFKSRLNETLITMQKENLSNLRFRMKDFSHRDG